MPSWNDIQNQIMTVESSYDQIRRKYLKQLEEKNQREDHKIFGFFFAILHIGI